MPLTLMYITNDPVVAAIAQKTGVDRIWVDLEQIGKEARQAGRNTVKSRHTIADVSALRPVVTASELMVRVNPIHEKSGAYLGSETEIRQVLDAGADVVMLPMFRTCGEVERFVRCVDGRAKTMLLLETAEAAEQVEDILKLDGIDEVHIGLNDLHLAYGKKFMFELLCDGTVERLCGKLSRAGVKYGFGGIARVGGGVLPAELIIAEHYALGSSAVILSRSFCDTSKVNDPRQVEAVFAEGVRQIRAKEREISHYVKEAFLSNHREILQKVQQIIETM